MSSSLPPFARLWRLPVFTAILGGALATIFSILFFPLEYGSTVRLLVTQTNTTGLDPYTAAKSTERIASNLGELVGTTTFATSALARANGFDTNFWPVDEYEKRKAWERAMTASVVPGTGILTMTAYHPLRDQARILANAAAQEIAVQGPNYFGYNVRVQVVDPPLDSKWFARPKFLQNGAIGVFLGLLLGLIWVLVRSSERGRGDRWQA